jgi:hypothetical protein
MDREPTDYQTRILKRISELSGMHVSQTGLGKTRQVCSSLWRKRGKSQMSVVFDSSTNSRFIVTGPFDEEMPDYYIIIRDYRWWNDNETQVHAWMKECLPRGIEHHKGMVLTIQNESDVSNFLLRWQ